MEQSSATAIIRRKPLRASATIGNSRLSQSELNLSLSSGERHEDAAAFDCYVDTRKYMIDPELMPAPKVAPEPVNNIMHGPVEAPAEASNRAAVDANKNVHVRASSSLPNLLLASTPHPKIEESGLRLANSTFSPYAPSTQLQSTTRRLSKPPRVHARTQKPGQKLQKRPKKAISQTPETPHVFLLQYEQYPYNIQPGTLLGVFSTFQSVSAGAISHGAYAFSKEGMHDGTEYLTKTGRIRIIPTPVQHAVSNTKLPSARKHNTAPSTGNSAATAPGPAPMPPPPEHIPIDGKAGILVAVYQSPTGICCLGAFTNRRAAWAACKKEGVSLLGKEQLRASERWLDEFEMPHLKVREVGKGWHEWYVVVHRIDDELKSPH